MEVAMLQVQNIKSIKKNTGLSLPAKVAVWLALWEQEPHKLNTDPEVMMLLCT